MYVTISNHGTHHHAENHLLDLKGSLCGQRTRQQVVIALKEGIIGYKENSTSEREMKSGRQ